MIRYYDEAPNEGWNIKNQLLLGSFPLTIYKGSYLQTYLFHKRITNDI